MKKKGVRLQKLNSDDSAHLFKSLNLTEFAKDSEKISTIRSSAASDDEKDNNSESLVISNEAMIINDAIKTKKLG